MKAARWWLVLIAAWLLHPTTVATQTPITGHIPIWVARVNWANDLRTPPGASSPSAAVSATEASYIVRVRADVGTIRVV